MIESTFSVTFTEVGIEVEFLSVNTIFDLYNSMHARGYNPNIMIIPSGNLANLEGLINV